MLFSHFLGFLSLVEHIREVVVQNFVFESLQIPLFMILVASVGF
jgi:hypothetical protein